MSNKIKKSLREEYNRLKKKFEKIMNPGKQRSMPPPLLQPYRTRKPF